MANGITNVSIKDFLVFKGEFNAEFCPGVNVLIGGNGSGKTTLLKVLYMACDFSDHVKIEQVQTMKTNNSSSLIPAFELYARLSCHFPGLIDDSESNNLIPDPLNSKLSCDINTFDMQFFIFPTDITQITINNDNCELVKENYLTKIKIEGRNKNAIFIPTIDLLAGTGKILALDKDLILPLDITSIDILSKAARPMTREIKPNAIRCLSKIKEIIGGEVVFQNDTFYTVKDNGDKTPFSLEASGYRKLGLLWSLLRNGLLEEGSTLFWDEPENSINPELIPHLVDILLELQRGGVQIFIATHSYDIARWFELNKAKGDHLRYFNMRKKDGGEGIVADVADTYAELPESVLEDAGDKLLRRAMQVSAEKAGVKL